MADGDLCTFEYIVTKSYNQVTTMLQSIVEQNITDQSILINRNKKDDADPDDLQRACAYAVLAELVDARLIQDKTDIVSISEGDTSVTYNKPSAKTLKDSKSYAAEAEYYWDLVTADRPKPGRCIGIAAVGPRSSGSWWRGY